MIEYIKRKLEIFVDKRTNLLRDQQRLNTQEQLSYYQLSQLFKENNFIPFSEWAISPTNIVHVLNDISINKRKNIIEFGSGISTIYIAKLIKILNLQIIFYSVESNLEWANELERQLEIYQLNDFVKIIYAPLVNISSEISFKTQKIWYDPQIIEDQLLSTSNFDLILVDGPIGGSTPYARYSAIPFLKENLANNFSIFLDDIDRPEEKEIIHEWGKLLKVEIEHYDRYAVFKTAKSFKTLPFKLH